MTKLLIYLAVMVVYLIYKGYMKNKAKQEEEAQKTYTPPVQNKTITTEDKQATTPFEDIFGDLLSEFEKPATKINLPREAERVSFSEKAQPEAKIIVEDQAYQEHLVKRAAKAEKEKVKKQQAEVARKKRKEKDLIRTNPREAFKYHIIFEKKYT